VIKLGVRHHPRKKKRKKEVLNVKGEDPAAPGSLRGNKVRWHFGDPFRE